MTTEADTHATRLLESQQAKNPFRPVKALIQNILEHPHRHRWSVQGFGMLRVYLDADKVWRLNLWHSAMAVKNVSVLHDHPWDFTSWVVAGKFTNIRYLPSPSEKDKHLSACQPKTWNGATIQTGPGGGVRSETTRHVLLECRPEHFGEGCIYQQSAEEIHESRYEDGTCTINARIRRPDGEHARVFWPLHTSWVDAEPRDATKSEVAFVVEDSLKKWFTR